MGQPDGVAGAREEPLILQFRDDRLFGQGQPCTWHWPAGRETLLAQGDKARQETLEDESAV